MIHSPYPVPDRLLALRQIIATAEAAHAHVLLLTGDTFDNLRLPQAFLDSVRDVLRRQTSTSSFCPGITITLMGDSVYARGKFHQLPNVAVVGLSGDCFLFSRYDLGIWGRAHRDYGDIRARSPIRQTRTRW